MAFQSNYGFGLGDLKSENLFQKVWKIVLLQLSNPAMLIKASV